MTSYTKFGGKVAGLCGIKLADCVVGAEVSFDGVTRDIEGLGAAEVIKGHQSRRH